jgi:hypothetical protein
LPHPVTTALLDQPRRQTRDGGFEGSQVVHGLEGVVVLAEADAQPG